MRAAMQEVIRLANLEGVPLPPDNDVRFIDAMMPTFNPEGSLAMPQDVYKRQRWRWAGHFLSTRWYCSSARFGMGEAHI